MGDTIAIDRKAFDLIKNQCPALILGMVVFLAAFVGLLAQPEGLLSVFWPANPVLVALMIRYPQLRTIQAWSCAFIGFMAADLLIGNDLGLVLLLNITNCIFAAAYLKLFTRLSTDTQKLETPKSVFYLLAVNIIAVAISTLVFMLLVYPFFPELFDEQLWMGLKSWFTAGLVNNILIVPVILLAPTYAAFKTHCQFPTFLQVYHQEKLKDYLPLLALALSPFIAVWIGGLCALVLHIPALLWCALNYQLFTTVFLTLIMSIWLIVALNFGWIAVIPQTQMWSGYELQDWIISMRTGVALLSLIPFVIATSNLMQKKLMRQLKHAVKYDFLTQILSRSAFFNSAQKCMSNVCRHQGSLCICMLDLDYFKHINDDYGHAVGDKVLQTFALTVKSNLRERDIFARLGGEEFVLLMEVQPFDEAYKIADRIRQCVAITPVLDGQQIIKVTVSIGLIYIEELQPHYTLEGLLIDADEALYRAKQAGRNSVDYMIYHQSSTDETVDDK